MGVDINEQVISLLNEGNIHIEEPGLQQEFCEVRKNNNLKFSLKPASADIFIIAVPTPFKDNDSK